MTTPSRRKRASADPAPGAATGAQAATPSGDSSPPDTGTADATPASSGARKIAKKAAAKSAPASASEAAKSAPATSAPAPAAGGNAAGPGQPARPPAQAPGRDRSAPAADASAASARARRAAAKGDTSIRFEPAGRDAPEAHAAPRRPAPVIRPFGTDAVPPGPTAPASTVQPAAPPPKSGPAAGTRAAAPSRAPAKAPGKAAPGKATPREATSDNVASDNVAPSVPPQVVTSRKAAPRKAGAGSATSARKSPGKKAASASARPVPDQPSGAHELSPQAESAAVGDGTGAAPAPAVASPEPASPPGEGRGAEIPAPRREPAKTAKTAKVVKAVKATKATKATRAKGVDETTSTPSAAEAETPVVSTELKPGPVPPRPHTGPTAAASAGVGEPSARGETETGDTDHGDHLPSHGSARTGDPDGATPNAGSPLDALLTPTAQPGDLGMGGSEGAEPAGGTRLPEPLPAAAESLAPGSLAPHDAAAPLPLWQAVKDSPGYAPELLALAVVERLGEDARMRVSWFRDTYPTATAEGLANVTVRHFVRQARIRGALAGLTGPFALLLDSGGQSWTQARLVLHLAAAYGLDPTSRDRAAELLVLQGLHGSVETARAALDAAAGGQGRRAARAALAARLTGPLTKIVGPGLVRAGVAGLAARFVPGAGVLVGAVTDARGVEHLAVRARRYYRIRARLSAQESQSIPQEGIADE